jgi:manganese-dependent inorganic pyrophosphatase
MVVMADIAKSYMDMEDTHLLSRARTRYRNIVETLDGTLLTGNEHGFFLYGKVVMGVDALDVQGRSVESNDLVIVGDREETQMHSIASNCCCMIVTNGLNVSAKVLEAAKQHQVVVISTPYDSYMTACMLNQSMPIKYFMTKSDIINFHLDDYVKDVNVAVSNVRHRDFPILDDDQNYVGMFSRRNLLSAQKKQIILVDHNEKSQAVNSIEEAEILEVIDHHRLGSLETKGPVYFRNQPVGCTSTIISHMYMEKGVEIPKAMAGLMCSAIISDTLMFRSPTCTEMDKEEAKKLAKIAEIDIEEFAGHMFEAGSDFQNKTEEEILNQDFKIFHSGDIAFGVSQVSAMSSNDLERVHERINPMLDSLLAEKRINMMFVMLTNILKESTCLVYAGDGADQLASDAFHMAKDPNSIELPGVVSRKKQLIPELINALAE